MQAKHRSIRKPSFTSAYSGCFVSIRDQAGIYSSLNNKLLITQQKEVDCQTNWLINIQTDTLKCHKINSLSSEHPTQTSYKYKIVQSWADSLQGHRAHREQGSVLWLQSHFQLIQKCKCCVTPQFLQGIICDTVTFSALLQATNVTHLKGDNICTCSDINTDILKHHLTMIYTEFWFFFHHPFLFSVTPPSSSCFWVTLQA